MGRGHNKPNTLFFVAHQCADYLILPFLYVRPNVCLSATLSYSVISVSENAYIVNIFSPPNRKRTSISRGVGGGLKYTGYEIGDYRPIAFYLEN